MFCWLQEVFGKGKQVLYLVLVYYGLRYCRVRMAHQCPKLRSSIIGLSPGLGISTALSLGIGLALRITLSFRVVFLFKVTIGAKH